MTSRMRLSDNLFQYLALIFVLVVSVADLYGDGPWWLAGAFCLALGLVYQFWPYWWQPHLQLAAQAILIIFLLFLQPIAIVLSFTFAVYAVSLFPDRRGAAWIAAIAVIIGLAMINLVGWVEGLVAVMGVSVGLASFGFFTYARIQANLERRKSQQLLNELQEAHSQLKEYAGRVEELAVAEERNRLAREMHDTLGHRLTVAAVQLEGVQRLISSEPERAASMVATVRQQVVEALAELRSTVATLRAPLDADLPLLISLARLAKDFEDATGLPVHLDLPGEAPGLTGFQQTAVYRMVQEGLTNVQRHAHASQTWLTLACREDGVEVILADDGTGFPASQEMSGFGLRGLYERAAHLGGELTLGSRPGGGAQLILRLPLAPAGDLAMDVQKVAEDGSDPCIAGR
jgi:signal transduction histidine kinase